jgi:hypothetical protein
MTDPYADLERELLAAHARDLRPRRHLRAVPRVAFAMAAVAAVVLAFVAIARIASDGDPERAATPQPAAVECGGSQSTTASDVEPAPRDLATRLAILREGLRAEDPDLRLVGRQARHIYGPPRRVPPTVDWDIAVVAADIVPRSALSPQDDPCGPPGKATQPGVCLMLSNPEGGLGACFTVAELMEGKAFIDADGEIIGLAPDIARTVSVGDATCTPQDNLFHLPGGPDSKVSFDTA